MSDDSVWSYRPGDWLAVFGAATTVLLPAAEKARAAQLWELLDGGAGFGQTLDSVLASGLSALPAFVLIGSDEGPTKLIVRGAGVRVTATTEDETVVLDGAAATTWVERTLDGVTALSVEVDDGAEGPDHLIRGGLVRVARIDLPPYAARVEAEAAPLDAEPEAPAADEPDPLTEPMDLPAPGASPVWDDDRATVPPPPAPPLPPPYVPPVPVVDSVPSGAPESMLGGDHDGLTQAGEPSDEFARAQPGIPGQPPAPSVTRPVAKLVISNGETVEVDRVVLIGRAPEARRFTATEQPRLVTVPSPLHEISSTHVEVRPGTGADHGSAVVTDMGSTNGTLLVQPGLGPEELKPGIAVQLIPGAVINLGDGVTIQVTNP